MSLLASFLDTRTTRAAVAVAVALHGAVLFGLMQYSRTGHPVNTAQLSNDAYQPIQVVFVGEAVIAAPIAPLSPVPTPPMLAPAATPNRPAVQTPAPVAATPHAAKEAIAEAAPAAASQAVPMLGATAAVDTAARDVRPMPVVHRVEDTRSEGPPLQAGKPDYAYNPQPDYPMLLREQGVGGVVWLRVWVDSDGHPGEIKLAKGSGYRLLDDAALRAVRQWRFVPAKRGEQSLASWVEFPIRFTLNG